MVFTSSSSQRWKCSFSFNLDPDQAKPDKIEIVFDLQNNLESINLGKLKLSNITVGDTTVLNKRPDWPGGKTIESEKI